MASGNFDLTRTGSTSQYINFKCEWSSTSNGSSANSSKVTATVTATMGSSSISNVSGSQTTYVSIDGNAQSNGGSFVLTPGKTITLFTKSWTISHNTNGTKNITIRVSVEGNVMTGSGSATVALDTIPRYATANQNLSNYTETAITMNWSSDSVIDYIWYSSNNGSSWTGLNVSDGKSGSYTISGLTPQTTYYVKTRVRRKDSQLTTDTSSSTKVITYAYPYTTSTPNFIIGKTLKLGFYNPLGRNITVNILGADDSQISNDTTTGTSISGYAGDVVVNRLYASIPNTQSGTYKVKVTYGSVVTITNGGTYAIDKSACQPSISAVAYKDTYTKTTAITGNNQLIIQNQSIVQYTATGISGNKSATISSCSVKVNNNSYNLTISGTTATGGNASINSTSNVTATVTVTDSRGVTYSKSVSVSMLEWHAPTAIINIARHNNYYSETDINVDGSCSSLNGKNSFSIEYRYKKVSASVYGSSYTLRDGVTSTFTIDNNYAWNVQVILEDLLGTSSYIATVSRGMPIIYFDRQRSSVGINCFPQYDQSLEVNGYRVITEKNIMTRWLYPSTTTPSTIDTYTQIPLNQGQRIGTKLSSSGYGILIGDGVTRILVSGQMTLTTATTEYATEWRYVRIGKNSNGNSNALGSAGGQLTGNNDSFTFSIPPQLATVTTGDIIYLYYLVRSTSEWIQGDQYDRRTSLTVEVVG